MKQVLIWTHKNILWNSIIKNLTTLYISVLHTFLPENVGTPCQDSLQQDWDVAFWIITAKIIFQLSDVEKINIEIKTVIDWLEFVVSQQFTSEIQKRLRQKIKKTYGIKTNKTSMSNNSWISKAAIPGRNNYQNDRGEFF